MDRIPASSMKTQRPSPLRPVAAFRDKTPPLKRLDLVKATKGEVYIPKPLLSRRPSEDRSTRPYLNSRRSIANENSNRLSDTTDQLALPEMIPHTERGGRPSVDVSRDFTRESTSRAKPRGTIKRDSPFFSKDKLSQGSAAARDSTSQSSSKTILFKNRTTEKVEVTGKTMEVLKVILREIDELNRLFEEDSEGNQQQIFDQLYSIFVWAQKAEPYPIGFKALELYFTVTNLYKDFHKTIHLIKIYKSIATIYNDYPRKLDSYKWLALVYQDHQKIELALMYLKKMLRLAWAIGDHDRELLAYDLLGIQFYYLGEIDKASYFHQRMVNGELEPELSAHFRIAKNNFKATIAQRSFEDTLQKDEAYKVYVSSGEEEIDLPSKKEVKNGPRPKHVIIPNPTLIKSEIEKKYQCRQSVKSLHDRSQSQGRMSARMNLESGEEEGLKIINVEDYTRSLVVKRKQTVGAGKISHSIRLNHMSTNRIAENLHHLQHSAANFKEDITHGKYLDGYARAKISGLISKFQANIERYMENLRINLESRPQFPLEKLR